MPGPEATMLNKTAMIPGSSVSELEVKGIFFNTAMSKPRGPERGTDLSKVT